MVELAIWLLSAAVVIYFGLAGLGVLINILSSGRWKVPLGVIIMLVCVAVAYSYTQTNPMVLLLIGITVLYLYFMNSADTTDK